jgi:hypothetical protein
LNAIRPASVSMTNSSTAGMGFLIDQEETFMIEPSSLSDLKPCCARIDRSDSNLHAF